MRSTTPDLPVGRGKGKTGVCALSIYTGSRTYKGSASVLSPNWVLTAGHNVDFTGFGRPTIYHDLALRYFEDPLPGDLFFPVLGLSLDIGDTVTLAGFGRSGCGS